MYCWTGGIPLSGFGTLNWFFHYECLLLAERWGLRCPEASVNWKIKALPKIMVFLWLVINRAILIWGNLMKMSWQGPSFCVMCTVNEETIDHIFNRCYLSFIFEHIGTFPQIEPFTIAPNCGPSLVHLEMNAINKRDMILWDLSAIAIFWEIWMKSNNRLFNNSATSCYQIFISALLLFHIGSISFQTKQERWHGGRWPDSDGGGL